MPSGPYAHTKTNPDGSPAPIEDWEPLFTPLGDAPDQCQGKHGAFCQKCADLAPEHGHLNKVAHLASSFAADMFPEGPDREAARQWGRLAGLWHDLGKFSEKFQAYLSQAGSNSHTGEATGHVDHSTAGAQHANDNLQPFGTLLAYLIAGHHAGLADGIDTSDSNLEKRLKKTPADYREHVPDEIPATGTVLPAVQFALPSGYSLGFFLRLLFSALVDADFLGTEAFMNPAGKGPRPTDPPSFATLETTLTAHLDKLSHKASPTPVNRIRAEILQHCLVAAGQQPGLFSLTVPTGGGKTLSSLAFALKHSRLHDLRRVIYVMKSLTFHIGHGDWSADLELSAEHTLHDLAATIIAAVGFDFDHSFGFYDNLRSPYRSKQEYTLFADMGEDAKEDDPGVENTPVTAAFKPKKKMLFLFDYGDDWFFLVTCTGEENRRAFKRPKILATSGTAPQQYPDWDEDD